MVKMRQREIEFHYYKTRRSIVEYVS